jgi:hypothetical protein
VAILRLAYRGAEGRPAEDFQRTLQRLAAARDDEQIRQSQPKLQPLRDDRSVTDCAADLAKMLLICFSASATDARSCADSLLNDDLAVPGSTKAVR